MFIMYKSCYMWKYNKKKEKFLQSNDECSSSFVFKYKKKGVRKVSMVNSILCSIATGKWRTGVQGR